MLLYRHHEQGALSIYNSADVTVRNCSFYNNTSTGYFSRKHYQGGSGGVIIGYNELPSLNFVSIVILVINCNFTANNAKLVGRTDTEQLIASRIFIARGGALSILMNVSASVNCTVGNNLFADNTAQNVAGALFTNTQHLGLHKHYFVNNTFIRNSAPVGGAFLFASTTTFVGLSVNLNVYNCIFQSNVAQYDYAGAMVLTFIFSPYQNVVNIKDCTFSNNSAISFAGAFHVDSFQIFGHRNATAIRFVNWYIYVLLYNFLPCVILMSHNFCSIFNGNSAPDGAAINLAYYSVAIENVTFISHIGSTLRVSY